MRLFISSVVLLISLQAAAQSKKTKIRVACIGNSITYGYGINDRETKSYPAQLQALLGSGYEVTNYGVSSATLLRNGNFPYWDTNEYKKALQSNPDLVFIKLGTNDSKLVNRKKYNEFEEDYHDLITSFAQLPSHPRIVLLLPLPSFQQDTTQIWDRVITREIIPRTQAVAYLEKCEVVNLYPLFINKPELIPDKIHPNAEGASIIAKAVYNVIVDKREPKYDIFSRIALNKKISSFYGYECADFTFKGRSCKIVKPKLTAENRPWIWRARFWGHEPQTDLALLERGFHVVYCDVSELYGNAAAIELWDNYYLLLREAGLSKKAVLEGMSRGGVYVYNWAAANPGKVACVYADNPVLDLKSWPGGKGKGPGSKRDWEIFKIDYELSSDAKADAFKGSPIDKVDRIVKGNYPMLHVCGDADAAVPFEENTGAFEQKVKAMNGKITVIHKPGFKHHPHSLPNPTPIVDFILDALKAK